MNAQQREARDARFRQLMEEDRAASLRGRERVSQRNPGLEDDIRAARRRYGWTQEELARRTGILQPNIARLESGRAQPKMRTLRKLADALGARLVVRLELD